jgi:hypothetical protein
VLQAAIPGGAYDTSAKSSWKANGAGTTHTWKTCTPVAGLFTALLKWGSGKSPGTIKFKAIGKDGEYGVAAEDLPLWVQGRTDTTDALTAQCGQLDFGQTPSGPGWEAKGRTALCRSGPGTGPVHGPGATEIFSFSEGPKRIREDHRDLPLVIDPTLEWMTFPSLSLESGGTGPRGGPGPPRVPFRSYLPPTRRWSEPGSERLDRQTSRPSHLEVELILQEWASGDRRVHTDRQEG